MEEIFFVRFSLQQSCGIFKENQFSCDGIIGKTKEEIESYIKECDKWQQQTAEKLRERYGDMKELEGKRVLYVGDSLTADRTGYRGITTKAAGLDAHSMAFSGATSIDMLRSIYGDVVNFKPEVVTVLIGTNDIFYVGGDEKINLVSREEYKRNLTEIISICKKSGADVMVITLPETLYKNDDIKENDSKNVSAYNDIIKAVSEKTGAVLIDWNSVHKSYGAQKLLDEDGVHLNKEGQAMLADLWIQTLKNIVS